VKKERRINSRVEQKRGPNWQSWLSRNEQCALAKRELGFDPCVTPGYRDSDMGAEDVELDKLGDVETFSGKWNG